MAQKIGRWVELKAIGLRVGTKRKLAQQIAAQVGAQGGTTPPARLAAAVL